MENQRTIHVYVYGAWVITSHVPGTCKRLRSLLRKHLYYQVRFLPWRGDMRELPAYEPAIIRLPEDGRDHWPRVLAALGGRNDFVFCGDERILPDGTLTHEGFAEALCALLATRQVQQDQATFERFCERLSRLKT